MQIPYQDTGYRIPRYQVRGQFHKPNRGQLHEPTRSQFHRPSIQVSKVFGTYKKCFMSGDLTGLCLYIHQLKYHIVIKIIHSKLIGGYKTWGISNS